MKDKEKTLKYVLATAEAAARKAQARYDALKAKEKILNGVLADVDPGKNRVYVESVSDFARRITDFPVAPDATIIQDNLKIGLAELKKGSQVTLVLDTASNNVVKIAADGGTVQGVFMSSHKTRNTIAIRIQGEKNPRFFHLVKETEVLSEDGKTIGIQDFKHGTFVLLTLSVEDVNTIIRVQDMTIRAAAAPAVSQQPDQDIKPPAPSPQTHHKREPERRFVNSTNVTLNYELTDVGPSGVSQIVLYHTPDQGQTWSLFGVWRDIDPNNKSVTFVVAQDGLYGFSLIVRNKNGRVDKQPRAGIARRPGWKSIPSVRWWNFSALPAKVRTREK